ncbi:MAG: hypothetical protein JNL07_08850, partial [Rhodospirillales bacterium]|nr:hypothetical protein [Rhodospirillales bacterium]
MPVSSAPQGFDIDLWPAPDAGGDPDGASLIDPPRMPARPGGADALPAEARAVFDRVRAREDDHFVSSQTHDARLAWREAFEAGIEPRDAAEARRDDGLARGLTTRIDADIARRLEEAPSPEARRRLDEALRTARRATLAEAVRVEHGARVADLRGSLDARLAAIAARAVEAPDGIDGGIAEARALLEANLLLVPARERDRAIARFERETTEGAVARLVDVDPAGAARLLEQP